MDYRKKVLLMGSSNAGKSSMRAIVFANFMARDTQRLNPTLDVQHSSVRFLGSLVLNLWDCGGQDAFYESYFASRREHVFSNVAVLIYVFDITSGDVEKDLAYYAETASALGQYSPGALIFVLIHKMDLVPEESREGVFAERSAAVHARSGHFAAPTFATSIWDETLYKAWSSVVHTLIPNIKVLEDHLGELAASSNADEIVLFERVTFLVISHVTRTHFNDVHRFEKISNIVKQFKLACTKEQAQFQGLKTGNAGFSLLIEAFTSNTFIMVVAPPRSNDEATLLDVAFARRRFDALIATI